MMCMEMSFIRLFGIQILESTGLYSRMTMVLLSILYDLNMVLNYTTGTCIRGMESKPNHPKTVTN